MFVENNITAIPIIKDDKEIIGIVTDADLLYKEVKPCVPQYVNLLGANIYYGNLKEYQQGFKKLFACTAEQLMTKKSSWPARTPPWKTWPASWSQNT